MLRTMHIALPIAKNIFEYLKGRMVRNKVKYQEVGGSLYVSDPNNLTNELMPYE